MRKFLIPAIAAMLLAFATASFAAEDDEKGASESAYEHASEKSVFNRMGDWFATVGKSDEEKAKILKEREATRAEQRTKSKASEPPEKVEGDLEKEKKEKTQETEKIRERTETQAGEAKGETERHRERIETQTQSEIETETETEALEMETEIPGRKSGQDSPGKHGRSKGGK